MKINWKITFIIILAAFLRFHKLGLIPPSLDWDEASLAYNAKAILETGRDEYGNYLPITIRSFNDYKPSLYTYILIPTLKLLGEGEFAVRFPSALAGTLTVLITFLLAKQLFPNKSLKISNCLPAFLAGKLKIEELSALLLAISPWHLQLSRIAFEANLGLSLFIFGIYALLKARSFHRWFIIASLSFGLSLVAYHSTKVIIPLFLLIIGWPLRRHFFKNKKTLIISTIIALFFSGLILRTIQLGIGQSRFNSVSFLTKDNLLDESRSRIETENFSLRSRLFNHRYLVFGKEILSGYFDHYTAKFWFVQGDSIARSTFVSSMGVLYWWTFPFIIIGILALASQKSSSKKILFSWFLIAPTASALTSGTPNAVRSIFFLPTFQIFTALGLFFVLNWLQKQNQFKSIIIKLLLYSIITANISLYFHLYYRHASSETSQDWQYGYKQMVQKLMPLKDNYQQIIITTAYDQPYIYLLWYGQYSPRQITNNGEFAKGFQNFKFREIDWATDPKLENTLLIAAPHEIKQKATPIWQVDFLDGTPAFLAVESKGEL